MKKFSIFIVFSLGWALASQAMQSIGQGIYVLEDARTIVLKGKENKNKTLIENRRVTTLYDFSQEITGFNWSKYSYKNYKVIIEETNIHATDSIQCLFWFKIAGFQLFLTNNSFISLDALHEFARRVDARKNDEFHDIIFKVPFPIDSSYAGYAKTEETKQLLKEKNYLSYLTN